MDSKTPTRNAKKRHKRYGAVAFTFSLLVHISSSSADLFRCRQPDGTIELSDSGCGDGVVEQQYRYSPEPSAPPSASPLIARPTSAAPSYAAPPRDPDADAAARKLGFRDAAHFSTNLDYCMEIYGANVTSKMNLNCGSNLECLEREAKLMTQRASDLMRSSSWKAYNCDVATQVAIRSQRSGGGSYTLEFVHNDELFIINGEKFEAKTYCFGWSEGDEVVFAEGSPYGACSSATLVNLRNKNTCEVWCE